MMTDPGKNNKRELIQKYINKEKWWETLSRFIDVLRVNIFIVDDQGVILLPPEESKYGGNLLTDQSLNFDLIYDNKNFLEQFRQSGKYFESHNRFGLNCFALPIIVEDDQVIAYLIIGPLILNKRLDADEYDGLANKYGVNHQALLDEINSIRIVSNLMMNSILDLLSEIVKNSVELSSKKQILNDPFADNHALSEEISKATYKIKSTVRLDELLATLLDVALTMTETDSGSIMILDEEKQELSVKVSRGINKEHYDNSCVKLGEGISGIAAEDNEIFVIDDQHSDQRIHHLLHRQTIHQSLVMPLSIKERVLGVLNLNSNAPGSKIRDHIDNLQYLSQLLAAVY